MVGEVKNRAGKPSAIVAHRLFPAVAALWFAALFGLGSLALPTAMIEDAVLAARLDTLISAAAPPLGLTARLLIALAMSGVGAVIGLIVATVFSRLRKGERRAPEIRVRARDAHPDAPARRPLSATTELASQDDNLPVLASSEDFVEPDVPEAVTETDRAAPRLTSADAMATRSLSAFSLVELSTRLASAMAEHSSHLPAGAAAALGRVIDGSLSDEADTMRSAAPGDTQRALEAALTKLQRVSGAA